MASAELFALVGWGTHQSPLNALLRGVSDNLRAVSDNRQPMHNILRLGIVFSEGAVNDYS